MKYILGFLTGAVFGAAVALLYAPKSGEELRAELKTEADMRYHNAQHQWQHRLNEFQGLLDKVNVELKNSIDNLRPSQSEQPTIAE